MKKHLKTVLFSALLLSAVLLSCGEDGDTVTETDAVQTNDVTETHETETDLRLSDAVPDDVKFEGETLAFLSDAYGGVYSTLFAESEDGEVLNDAKLAAKQYTEEQLGITITEEQITTGPWDTDSEILKLVMAGDNTYDVVSNMDRFMFNQALEGAFYPISDLPHIDLTAPYWNPDTTDLFKIGSKTYFAMSSFSLYSYSNTCVILANEDLVAAYDIPDLYQTVYDGKWTYDLLMQYAQNAYVDLNGSGDADVSDRFGYIVNKGSWLNSVIGCGCKTDILQKDADNYFTFGISEKMVDVLEMAYEIHASKPYVGEVSALDFKMAEGHTTLFTDSNLGGFSNLRNLDYDLMVLPIPKYDESRASYQCRTYDSYFTMVPVSSERTALCGAALEILSCKAYNDTKPAFIETTLKDKISKDQATADMISLIIDSRTILMGEAFLFDYWGDQYVFDKYICGNNASPASYIAKTEKQVLNQIKKYNKFFQKLAEE